MTAIAPAHSSAHLGASQPSDLSVEEVGLTRLPVTLPFVPEFIIEVASPEDEVREVESRIPDYLENGALLVWLILPRQRAIRVPRADGALQQFRENDVITGESVLPDFKITVKDVLPPTPAPSAVTPGAA